MGRHSAPDDDDDLAVAPSHPGRPRPGRHAGAEEDAQPASTHPRPDGGLALIEQVLDEPDAPSEVDPIDPADRTAVIPVIADPILDQPVPEADTDQIPAVVPDDAVTQQILPVGETAAPADADAPTEAPTESPAAAQAADAPVEPPPGAAPPPPPGAPAPKASRGSAADLALLRGHRDVLARCAAAVIAPIAIYVVVLAVVGALELPTVLIWCAVPLVVAGVLVGLLLDAGHKRYPVSGSPDRP